MKQNKMINSKHQNNITEGFEIFPTTADCGINVWSSEFQGLFRQSARALFSIITDISLVEAKDDFEITLESPSLDDLLISWLNELIYLSEVNNYVFSSFSIKHLTEIKLHAIVSGERIDFNKHTLKSEVKAATYHALEVNHKKMYTASIIVDL